MQLVEVEATGGARPQLHAKCAHFACKVLEIASAPGSATNAANLQFAYGLVSPMLAVFVHVFSLFKFASSCRLCPLSTYHWWLSPLIACLVLSTDNFGLLA